MTNAELAILGLIAERPRHGYEIEQVIQERGMREWTEVGFSSIYYLLRKLEGEGLLVSRIGRKQGRGPAPKVYRLTSSGRDAWRQGVKQALSRPQGGKSPFQLGLANAAGLPACEVLEALRLYRERLAERKEFVRGRAQAQQPLPDHVEALFDYSLVMIKAEEDWLADYIEKMEKAHGYD